MLTSIMCDPHSSVLSSFTRIAIKLRVGFSTDAMLQHFVMHKDCISILRYQRIWIYLALLSISAWSVPSAHPQETDTLRNIEKSQYMNQRNCWR